MEADGYEAPPPLPRRYFESEDSFGTAEEDGLRMLAALGTMTSLEPDYTDDLASEASVTIIEAMGDELVADALAGGTLRSRLREQREPEPPLLLNGYETFAGPGDEAEVEIVEPARQFDAAPPPLPRQRQAPSLAERIALATGGAAGSRFYKALSGKS